MGEDVAVRILTSFSEKQRTRPLYEEAFEDPPAFVDYYYREKCADNKMAVLEEDGQIRSMVHLNPYTVCVHGNKAPSYYLVAVATDRQHRGKGYMTRVLRAAFTEMEREGVPFCFLLPVNEAIYKPFCFETVCGFITRDHPLSALSYGEVQKRYDVYCVRDGDYERRRRQEDFLAEEDASEVLPKNPVIMARVIDERAFSALFPETARPADLKTLKACRCYFREEV